MPTSKKYSRFSTWRKHEESLHWAFALLEGFGQILYLLTLLLEQVCLRRGCCPTGSSGLAQVLSIDLHKTVLARISGLLILTNQCINLLNDVLLRKVMLSGIISDDLYRVCVARFPIRLYLALHSFG